MNKIRNDQGTALVATLMFLMAMGVLSTALVFTVHNEMKSSATYKYGQQAFYVANAGIQNAVQWFNSAGYSAHSPASDYDLTKSPIQFQLGTAWKDVRLTGETGTSTPYPDGAVAAAFAVRFRPEGKKVTLAPDASNEGGYALTATLLTYREASFINEADFSTYTSAIERWRLNSTGAWGPDTKRLGTAQITAIIENSGNSLFDRALWGVDSVNMIGGAYIDSYNPDDGPYDPEEAGELGAIGTNGTLSGDGSIEIHGVAAYGPEGSATFGDNTEITGNGGVPLQLAQERYFPPVPPFDVDSKDPGIDVKPKGTATPVEPGTYGTVFIQGPVTFNPGDYYIDSLNVTSQGEILVTGNTTFYVKSAFSVAGNGFVNPTSSPVNLRVFYAGGPTDDAKLRGSSSVSIEYYGPEAPLELTGGSDYFGSFIGKSVKTAGGTNIHFSEPSLNKNLLKRPYRLITWSQDTY